MSGRRPARAFILSCVGAFMMAATACGAFSGASNPAESDASVTSAPVADANVDCDATSACDAGPGDPEPLSLITPIQRWGADLPTHDRLDARHARRRQAPLHDGRHRP